MATTSITCWITTRRAPAAWTPEDFRVLPWLREQVSGERHSIVATWPDTLSLRFPDAPAIRVVHGSPRSHWEPIHRDTSAEDLATMLAGVDESYVLAGHTHLPMDRSVDGWRIFNPGSAGLPLDGIFDAQYMLLDGDESGWRPSWRRIVYDHTPFFDAFERARLAERCGPIGQLMIEEFRTNRIHVHAFVVWRNQHHPGQPFTDELLQAFKQADRWEYTESAYHVNRDAG